MSEIRSLCPRCRGDGEIPSSQPDPLDPGSYNPVMITCHWCGGSGSLKFGMIVGDLLDKVDDILNKCNDIMDKLKE